MGTEYRDNHIVSLIESDSITRLRESDLALIQRHIAECTDCRAVYEVAKVSSVMLHEHAAQTFEPSPFFQTRVLAALREREVTTDLWSFARLWRSAGALASSMIAAVVLLVVLTFIIPANQNSTQSVSVAANPYSPEAVILNQNQGEMTSDGQVLSTLYAADEEASH